MVSTCLRGRSLLGACLEKTEENKGRQISTCSSSESHRCGMSGCITLHHLLSLHVQAPLSTIPCPNVAWSRARPHLECVGPSIIPPAANIYTKQTSLFAKAKSRVHLWSSPFQSHIQLWAEREDGAKRDRSWQRRNRRSGSMRTLWGMYQKSVITTIKKKKDN